MLQQQLERVHQRIAQACQRCGRVASSVTLVAVTKGVAVDVMREAVGLGVMDIGENRVQEARTKRAELAGADAHVRWHLIGHLQRNKVAHAVELFDAVHSVDSLELAQALTRAVAGRRKTLEVFVQVNVSGEQTKFGCRPQETRLLAQTLLTCPNVTFAGLMTIAPFSNDPEAARPVFRQLRELKDALVSGLKLPSSMLKLSMGMSDDFEVAIEEGADLVRIGTALFGDRG